MGAQPLTGKALTAVRASTASICAYEGTVRSGKTVGEIVAWVKYARRGPAGSLLMVGKTQRTVKQNVIDPMVEMLGPKRCRYVAGAGILHLLGRTIYVVGANDESSVTKIQGLTLAGALVDEASTMPQTFFEMLYSRLSIAGAQLFLTSNPAGPQHWLKVDWLDRAKLWIDRDGREHRRDDEDALDLVRISFKLEDNEHLPADYVERTKNSYRGLFYRRYILGEWVAAEGAIFDVWDPEKHVIAWADLPDMERLVCLGVDHGTTNPTAGLLLGVGVDGRLYFVDEFRHDPKRDAVRYTDAEMAQKLIAWINQPHHPRQRSLRPEYVAIDPAAASFRLQMHRDGVTSTPAHNEVLYGLSLITSLLGNDQLFVSDRCTGWITEVPGYAWDPKATEKGEDKPIKVADHSCFVAGTLVLTDMGERPIESIRPGDCVMTRDGWKAVEASGVTDMSAKVYRVELSNGRSFTGTGNHPVWVDEKGWIRIDALRYADKMVTWESVSKSSFSTGSSSADTRTLKASPTSGISRRASGTASKAPSASMRKSGWLSTGEAFPRVTTSTTPTATTTTTPQTTSSASPQTNTRPTTAHSPAVKPNSATGSTASPERLRGTAPKQGEHGTPSTASRCGRTSPSLPSHVTTAQLSTQQSRRVQPTVSVQTPASLLGDAMPGSTMNVVRVNYAARSSRLTDTARPGSVDVRVLRVTELPEEQPVWNLSVADKPEYFASGVLVHNCDAGRYALVTSEALWRPFLIDPLNAVV